MNRFILMVCIVLLALVVWGGFAYKRLDSASKDVEAKWALVEASYDARLDLMESLAERLEGAMREEATTFESMRDARARRDAAQTTDEKARVTAEIESLYAEILFALESYPNLAAAGDVVSARSSVEATSAPVLESLRNYNEAVRVYNMRATGFPGGLASSMFGFDAKAYFQSADI